MTLWKVGEDGLGAADRARVVPLPHSGAGPILELESLFCAACRWSRGCWSLLTGSPAVCLTSQEREIKETRVLQVMSEQRCVWKWVASWIMNLRAGLGGKTGQWQPEHCVWSPGSSLCTEQTFAGSSGCGMLEVPCLWLGSASEAEEEGALLSAVCKWAWA